MNITSIDPTGWSALLVVGRVTVLLGVAAGLQWMLRRRVSAATSHLVWSLAIAGILLLPLAAIVAPSWALVARTDPSVREHVTDAAVVPAAPGAVDVLSSLASGRSAVPAVTHSHTADWSGVVAWTYGLIAFVLLVRLVLQHRSVQWLRRRAAVIADTEWTQLFSQCETDLSVRRSVALLRSRDLNVPVAFGTRRPAIMVPAMADTWTDDRRRAVLRHELAHVVRYDCLTQALAEVACAVYWFHPLVWWASHRLRIERELACDDRVIAAGTQPRAYAGHLLEIAYSLNGRTAPALAVGMARPRQLEGRMIAALDEARNRAIPSRRVRVAGACVAGGLLLALGGLHPTAVVAATALETFESMPPAPETLVGRPGSHVHFHDKPSLKTMVGNALAAAAGAMGLPDRQRPGTWEIQTTDAPGMVSLRVTEEDSSSQTTVPVAELDGLTGLRLENTNGPVQFKLRRDAGTFSFDGVLKNGVGAGTFEFTPDPAFADGLAKRGFARPTAREQYQLARSDVGYAFLDELNAQGYAKPQTADLVRAGQHGVNPTYLREMGTLGYRLGSLDPLITLRDHGITPDYVRQLGELGYKGLSAEAIRLARDHGITPDYVRAMRDAGYGSLPMDRLINARDHGITPDYVRALGDAGYRGLVLDDVINVRDHGITPNYVREMRDLGYQLPLADLVLLRDHGVDAGYTREMSDLGYRNLPAPTIMKLRDHGITPQYVKELGALGYEHLSTDDVIMLRDHGVTPDRIRAANTKANTRLPIDMLRSYVDGGGR